MTKKKGQKNKLKEMRKIEKVMKEAFDDADRFLKKEAFKKTSNFQLNFS
ncbi:hypothetical protein HY214_00525 [Candidatus Roizmanbacteria bacterium]|nr:hypothetical protein [Candidatus Roizmanbacteria bacterium]